MVYNSTRGGETGLTASQAILKGLSEDGGLFVPEKIPALPGTPEELSLLSYQELAYQIMKEFFTDFTEEELRNCVTRAYDSKFDDPKIAPVVPAGDCFFLELYHGKTIAFKDMALSILPYLMVCSARKNNLQEKICILTATSGDTGKAAMAGFEDVPGTEIIVFYPQGGVSRFQELQMRSQTGTNTHVSAIVGNFDDAQTAVKQIFSDRKFESELKEKGVVLSSANSINIGRLIPQVVYYVYAYGQMLRQGVVHEGEEVNFCVPTGNFGNILACFIAKKMGLPVGRLICASNENNVLTDFFRTGVYDKNRPFILTTSPSMDILVSSNLERLLYYACGEDPSVCVRLMKELSASGKYRITPEMQSKLGDFYADFATEEETAESIRDLKECDGYLADPHTCVGKAVYEKYRQATGDERPTVVASTASPYKFAPAVMAALGDEETAKDVFRSIDALSKILGGSEPRAVREVREGKIRHSTVSEIPMLRDTIRNFLFGNS